MKRKVDEWNNNFKQWNGFANDGSAYVFLGNTYDCKDQIKALGAKWNPNIKAWVIDHSVAGYELLPINIDDVYQVNGEGKYDRAWENSDGVDSIVQKLNDFNIQKKREEAQNKGIGYVGEIGEKIVIECMLVDVKSFYSGYSYYGGMTYKYIFNDVYGNVIVWSTSQEFDDEEFEIGSIVVLKGKVKDHREYKGTPQTLVTRCKLIFKEDY